MQYAGLNMHQNTRSILIVDSSSASIFYASTLLRKLRYAVRSVRNAEDALNAIADSTPALVITDVVLPKMSGIVFLKKIKNNAGLRFLPVIIHTSDEKAGLREDCIHAGCAAYFLKPVAPETIYPAIQSAIESTPRENIRINAALKVQIGPEAADPRFRIENVLNISEGGVYVKTSAPEPVKALVSLSLFMGKHTINATALVVHSSSKADGVHSVPGMAMQFTKISAGDVNLIREFVRTEVMRGPCSLLKSH